MYDSRAFIIKDETRNGLAAGALAIIGSAFPVGWLFAESAIRADPGLGMGMAMLAWFGISILGGMLIRFLLNIFWRPRVAYFYESPISLKTYLFCVLALTVASLYCGHAYHDYEKKQDELDLYQQQMALAKLEDQLHREKVAKDQDSLSKLMNMTFAEKLKASRDSIANIPLGTTYVELTARVPNLYCEQPPNPRVKLCHGRFGKEVFHYALMDEIVFRR